MGVKILDLIEKKDLKWNQLENKKLAIDASNVLFQFLSSIRQQDGTPLMNSEGKTTSHLVGLFSRVPNMLQKGITPIFVFDGKAPDLKEKVREIRRANKAKAREKFLKAKSENDLDSSSKYAKQLSVLNNEMIQESKDLLTALGLPTVQAKSEAEAQCAYMTKKKKVWATGSQDYDTLLFGSPRLIQNLTLSTRRRVGSSYVQISPYIIDLKETLDKLEITQEQLIILSIMIGTDYNPKGVKGIGPKKALNLVQSGKKFDHIFSDLNPKFDWEEIYKIFVNMPVEDVSLTSPKRNDDKVKEILCEKHNFTIDRVENTLKKLEDKKDQSLKKWF
jgi:flap endonuclease-1